MLVLSRKTDEQIFVGDDITITIVEIRGNRVKLAIKAPSNVIILRGELRKSDEVKSGEPRPAFSTRAG
jgi:carbon storage regulator